MNRKWKKKIRSTIYDSRALYRILNRINDAHRLDGGLYVVYANNVRSIEDCRCDARHRSVNALMRRRVLEQASDEGLA